MDPAAVTANANSKVLRIEHIAALRGATTPGRMNAIATIVDEWRAEVGPLHAPPAPRLDSLALSPEEREVLVEAIRACRVEDAPNPLIRDSDVEHVAYMVRAAVERIIAQRHLRSRGVSQ